MGQSEGDLEQPSGWSCIAQNKSNTAVAEAAAEQPRSSAAPESLWSSIVSSTFGVFESNPAVAGASTLGYWTMAMRRAVGSNTTMRRLRSCILGLTGTNTVASSGTLWLLGLCYKMPFNSENDSVATQVFAEFLHDFSSRIWITYRRGFVALEESKLTSDVGWGCMIRSGQMLLAQALVCHYLGRSWRRELNQPHAQEYLEILKRFADAQASTCPFSIHNLIDAGRPYGLCAGTWLGPYALCRSIEALACIDREHCRSGETQPVFPMAICVVSGGADEDRGGAPVLYIDDVADLCSGWQYNSVKWAPLLVLVPLVLGVAKVNPRCIPSLRKTFCFPQSVGIVGGKPKASTYLVGFQENQVLYLDPHELQQVVNISNDDFSADTSSYHCSVIRSIAMESLDPSLALGFYCQNQEDFCDFCERARELASQSEGAVMFTVSQRSNQITNLKMLTELDNFCERTNEKCAGDELIYSGISTKCDDGWQLL